MLSPHATVRGPLPRHTPVLVDALRESGCEVQVVPWGRHGDDDSVLRRLWSRIGDVLRVSRLVRRTDFDVLVVKTSHEWISLLRDLPFLLATRRSSPCTVLQFHGGHSVRLGAPGPSPFKAASWALLRLCDGVLLLSSEEARAASQFSPRGTYRVVINPFEPAFDSAAPAVSASGPDQRSTILFVGRLIPEKGVFDLIEAAAAMRTRLPIRAVVVGDGPAASELERRAQELGLGLEDLQFTGELDHDRLRELYETSDVFVLPTYWVEGFPTVISEAMNAGLPIVTTRMRGMADHLQEDENALFVAPKAPHELGLTVERLLRDPELRARMGRANQEKVKLFAPAQAAAVYRAALTEIASGANGAAGTATAGPEQAPEIEEIREFWEQNPCGNETSDAADRLEYFRGLERFRYDLAPWIPEAAGFDRFAGKRVLEIGCGMGTDGAQFAAAGATYTGVDLTDAAVALARENFERRGLKGTFLTANAEHLPFPDNSFDHVYSFGVIHHTTRPEAIVDEIQRVLTPGGTVAVMLYNRNSINYRIEIMVLRKLGRLLLRPRSAPRLIAKLLRLPRATLEGHRRQLLRIAHPSHDEWVSMNTDGPDCPLARVYSAREVRSLFAAFDGVKTEVHMFDRRHWPLVGSLISDRMEGVIGRRVGWNRMTYATKRDT